MKVISLRITAVFKKPLSATRRPFSVSFSSLSPGVTKEFMSLKAVADILLSAMLRLKTRQSTTSTTTSLATHGTLYIFPVRLSRTVRLLLDIAKSAGLPTGMS